MLKGIDVNQRVEFSSKNDTSEPKTIFVFSPLSGIQMIDMSGMFKDGMAKLTGDAIVQFLSKCIVEIKNFEGETEKIKILNSLNPSVIGELIEEAGKLNNLTAQEAKN